MPLNRNSPDNRPGYDTSANIMRKKRPMPVDSRRRRPKPVKRRVRKGIIAVAAMLFITAVLLALSLTVLFPVKNIKVSGSDKYPHADIIKTAELETGGNIFTMSFDGMAGRLKEKYSYIGGVKIRRSFPSTVVIEITEAVPAAAVKTGGGLTLVDEWGKALETVNDDRGSKNWTVLVAGEIASPADNAPNTVPAEVMAVYMEIDHALWETEMKGIEIIDMTEPTDIMLYYKGRIAIRLGSALDIKEKLLTVKNAIERRDDGKITGVMNAAFYSQSNKEVYFKRQVLDEIP